jgi:hypothetical protein
MDNSPKGKIKQCRTAAATRQYQVVTNALDGPIRALFLEMAANNAPCRVPAVDLAAGSAYFTSQWALRYGAPTFCAAEDVTSLSLLDWYATDTTDAIATFTRPCLTYLAQEAEQQACLCTDRNGAAVFPQERIILQGLSNVAYNGKEGTVLHKDPKVEGRYAVRLDHQTAKPISFKADNLVVMKSDHGPGSRSHDGGDDTSSSSRSIEETQRRLLSSQNYSERDLFQGLLARSCDFDILKRDTWTSSSLSGGGQPLLLEKLHGQCALVTCTNLLTEIGHREPTAWKTVMEVAGTLLFPGGLLLQGDADGWGQFGNVPVMNDHAKSLGFTLQTHTRLEAWALVLWKKDW